MKHLLLVFLFIVPTFFSFDLHPIYVSTAIIDYKENEKSLEIAIQIFSDDLQKVISDEQGDLVEIGTNREHPKATEFIFDYLERNFKLEVNGKAVSYNYIGRKLERDESFAMWVFVEVEKVRRPKSIKLLNNILIDFHPSQKNIISFGFGDGDYNKFTTYEDKVIVELIE